MISVFIWFSDERCMSEMGIIKNGACHRDTRRSGGNIEPN